MRELMPSLAKTLRRWNSTVRRLLGGPPNPDRALAIALRGYAPAPAGPPEQLIAWVADGWPAYEAALKADKKVYEAYVYPGVNHGFHNDSTPRYDEAAAKLAWERTVAWFKKYLV